MTDWIIPDGQDVLTFAAFVYVVTLPDGTWYLGKKNVWSKKDGKIAKASDWRTYWGSSKEVKARVKAAGRENCRREIIRLCESTGKASWVETVELIERRAMLDDKCLNGNVGERFQRKVVQGWHDDGRCERYMRDTARQRQAAGLLE